MQHKISHNIMCCGGEHGEDAGAAIGGGGGEGDDLPLVRGRDQRCGERFYNFASSVYFMTHEGDGLPLVRGRAGRCRGGDGGAGRGASQANRT